ncbi:MAG TPA: extracellular solute-binding protein [Acidimicrobiia bacterium]|nr:extracellular solute-binding protein [Acidimicrobiia bacterium]
MVKTLLLMAVAVAVLATACGGDDATLTIYSGRSEDLVAPLIADFEEASGLDVEVRYGDSAELAATILEEGDNSPADVFFAQDPASLGAVALDGLFSPLSDSITGHVPAAFSDDNGLWVGVSGRARVVVYDTTKVDPAEFPPTEKGFTDPIWEGRLAVAPTNGSFLAFVAAKILIDGEAATLAWLQGIAANNAPTYPRNSVIVAAVDDGEVETGLVNHYYLFRRIAEEGEGVVAANHFLSGGGAGSLVMPAGVGILDSSASRESAERFVEFLLGEEAQRYFAEETFEYPLAAGVTPDPDLPPLTTLNPPPISLSDLATVLDRATDLVAEAGLL